MYTFLRPSFPLKFIVGTMMSNDEILRLPILAIPLQTDSIIGMNDIVVEYWIIFAR